MAEFTPWPKTLRLYRDIIVTEKIDGTNSGIHIELFGDVGTYAVGLPGTVLVGSDVYRVSAQSRKRMITPGKSTDNYGFAAWVDEHKASLVETLGQGLHMGEWWGIGINRGYGLYERRFSLFNSDRYKHVDRVIGGVLVASVPVLYQSVFSDKAIRGALADLAENGSVAAPGYMNPEGVCVFHSQTRTTFKVTLDNQDASKWESIRGD